MSNNSAIGTESFATAAKVEVSKKLRWAIIGCGGISETHLRAIENIPEIEVVGGCDIKPERLELMRSKYGFTKTYAQWDKMLKELKPDIVDVCTPNGVHKPAVIAALNAGCHAITEKPMAMDPAECQEMIDAAVINGRKLCCGFQMRYHPACDMFMRAREAGDIGDIMFVKCRALRRRGIPNWGVFGQKELQGGGPMIDIGVHIIESAHYCMGAPRPVAASGNCWTFMGDRPSNVVSSWPNWDYKTYTVEDLAVGQVRFDNGAIMQIESSFCNHIENDVHTFEIVGTKGGFSFKDATLYTDHAGTMLNSKAAFLPSTDFGALFIAKFKNFASAILHDTPMRSPGEAGLAVQKIIDGVYRAAAAGKEVSID
ncbi:MAG: Gfo/Idh/MocA family oxidoreductase [Oligosphaeraceae bacterium]|nr:Gfo/Idh/MocA family oxidoreductase [Oligosphaeraceae bacterium]